MEASGQEVQRPSSKLVEVVVLVDGSSNCWEKRGRTLLCAKLYTRCLGKCGPTLIGELLTFSVHGSALTGQAHKAIHEIEPLHGPSYQDTSLTIFFCFTGTLSKMWHPS